MLLRALGGLELEGAAFRRPKPLLLLAYLTLEGPRSRRHLGELFWPEARNRSGSLSTALTQLRTGAPGSITADSRTVTARVPSDVAELLTALERRDTDQACSLYTGAFLDSVELPSWSAELEEWVLATREFVARNLRRALLNQATLQAGHGQFTVASERARAAYLLPGAPPPEPDELVQLHGLLLAGSDPQVERVRQEARELGMELSEARSDVRDRLQQTPAVIRLPVHEGGFTGRDVELSELTGLLQSPRCRVLSIMGPAGAGKSRLAVQAAAEQSKRGLHGDGIHFIDLEPVSSAASVFRHIAAVLEVEAAAEDLLPVLISGIGRQDVLLILDNFEHVLDAGGGLEDLVSSCPRLTLLITSRERPGIKAERVYPLAGLALPVEHELSAESARRYGAAELFEQRARQNNPRFKLTDDNTPYVLSICRQLDGLPLGIEMAAAWVRVLSCKELAAELTSSLDLLASPDRNAKERQRSMRSVFEYSWELLTDAEQAALKRLTVFQGCFERSAAADVAGATIPVIASLLDKSLLWFDGSHRYGCHQLLRMFIKEKLASDTDLQADARARHAHWFTQFISLQHARQESDGPAVLSAIDTDLPNLLAAWSQLLGEGSSEQLRRFVHPLRYYFDLRRRYREGAEFFLAASRQTAVSAELTGMLLTAAAWLLHQAGDFKTALPLAREAAISLAGDTATGERARCLNVLAAVAWSTGDYQAARASWTEALQLMIRTGNPDQAAGYYANLALAEHALGDLDAATRLLQEALAVFRVRNDSYHIIQTLTKLGVLQLDQNNLPAAKSSFSEALELAYETALEDEAPRLLVNLANIDYGQRVYAAAREKLHLALERLHGGEDVYLLAYTLARQGRVAAALGQEDVANGYFSQAAELGKDIAPVQLEVIGGVADLRIRQQRFEEAVLLLCVLTHHPALEAADRIRYAGQLDEARARLEPAVHSAAAEAGRTLPLGQAVEQVRVQLQPRRN